MKAWVVSIFSFKAAMTNAPSTFVVAILSARKSASYVKDFVENLHSIFLVSLEAQADYGKYNKATSGRQAKVISGCNIWIDSHPYVFRAQLSEIFEIRSSGDQRSYVKWKGQKYQRIRQNSTTYQIEIDGEEDPPNMEAPQLSLSLHDLFGGKKR